MHFIAQKTSLFGIRPTSIKFVRNYKFLGSLIDIAAPYWPSISFGFLWEVRSSLPEYHERPPRGAISPTLRTTRITPCHVAQLTELQTIQLQSSDDSVTDNTVVLRNTVTAITWIEILWLVGCEYVKIVKWSLFLFCSLEDVFVSSLLTMELEKYMCDCNNEWDLQAWI